MSFYQQYKKTLIGAVIGFVVVSVIPGTLWLHDSYADDRYVKHDQLTDRQIEQLDHKLFDIGQEILFAETEQQKAKWEANKEYYEREKAKLIRERDSKE